MVSAQRSHAQAGPLADALDPMGANDGAVSAPAGALTGAMRQLAVGLRAAQRSSEHRGPLVGGAPRWRPAP